MFTPSRIEDYEMCGADLKDWVVGTWAWDENLHTKKASWENHLMFDSVWASQKIEKQT